MHIIVCPNCDWFFASISRKYKKWAILDILMTITRGANMITRQIAPFFPCTFCALSVDISAFQDLQNSVPCLLTWISFFYIKFANIWYVTYSVPNLIPIWSPPLLHYILVCKIRIYMPKMTLSSLLTYFFYRKFANFRFIACFVPILILFWLRF